MTPLEAVGADPSGLSRPWGPRLPPRSLVCAGITPALVAKVPLGVTRPDFPLLKAPAIGSGPLVTQCDLVSPRFHLQSPSLQVSSHSRGDRSCFGGKGGQETVSNAVEAVRTYPGPWWVAVCVSQAACRVAGGADKLEVWVQIPASLLVGCVTFGRLLNLSGAFHERLGIASNIQPALREALLSL